MLDPTQSLQRQKRILAALNDRKLDAIVLGLPHHVYYAAGHRPFWLHSSAFALFADGRSLVITANAPNESAAADEILSYEANWAGTVRSDQPRVLAEQLDAILKQRKVKRLGIDASEVTAQLSVVFDGTTEPIDFEMSQIRRSKLPDELAMMRNAIRCSEAMYAKAREIIKPGLSEIDLYAELHAAAVKESGEPMTALLGNDYACGVGGGPPRKDHRAQAGQLWILDLGPSYRGYFADNARVFSVDRKPTDVQMKTWQAIVSVFPMVESAVKPGVSCRKIFERVDEHLKEKIGQGLPHHLGHGVGLQPHEYPHLNPKWDDVFVEGEIFTAEPGLYSREINGGIRIENQYVVTRTGVENLVDFPMELV
jgi:Xaa-Pro dipeptidase